jgi:hypothetical protein
VSVYGKLGGGASSVGSPEWDTPMESLAGVRPKAWQGRLLAVHDRLDSLIDCTQGHVTANSNVDQGPQLVRNFLDSWDDTRLPRE